LYSIIPKVGRKSAVFFQQVSKKVAEKRKTFGGWLAASAEGLVLEI